MTLAFQKQALPFLLAAIALAGCTHHEADDSANNLPLEVNTTGEPTPIVVATAPAPAPVVAATPAPAPVAPAPVTPPAPEAAADLATAAKELVAGLVIPEAYDAKGEKPVVQVNRARGSGDVVIDKAVVTAAVSDAIDATGRFRSTTNLYGSNRAHADKALYLALDAESEALGLSPSRSLTDAPVLFLTTVVGGEGANPRQVTVTITDADSGKVVAKGTRSL